jgi:hypothetical protein
MSGASFQIGEAGDTGDTVGGITPSGDASMAEVKLVDLEIIKRYSLAVRQEAAPAKDLLAALDASRATVQAAIDGPSSTRSRRARPPGSASVSAPVSTSASEPADVEADA